MRRSLIFAGFAIISFAVVALGRQILVPAFAAIQENPETARAAIAELRAKGPAGLDELFAAHGDAIAKGPQKTDAWNRLAAALDAVAMQKEAYASKLYWYTDLEQAKAAAQREGKAILSLRLLGTLDCDLSCANSRFFRTTLYPDPHVSKLLREKFVLHWKSERPVPVMTIDFGDGRVLKRTVTGNSIHYVLDSSGRPIDALPGLYSAEMFVGVLKQSLELVTSSPQQLREHHAAASTAAAPQMQAYGGLAPEVVAVIAAKNPPRAEDAARRAISKSFVEDPLVRLVRTLEQSIAKDTQQNELVLHRQIHEWFARGEVRDLESFNQRVYAELFLTPASDPWLGLAPADGFTALENAGLASSSTP